MNKMTIRIEIAKNCRNKLDLRIGDLTGASEMSNFTKEEVLSEISDEIDQILKPTNECKISNKDLIELQNEQEKKQ